MDLLQLNLSQKIWTLIKPFLFTALYFFCAINGMWVLAVCSVIILLFVTYVSTSHDLLHRTLGLNKRINNILLTVIEMLVLRSGQAFKICHLNHHKKFPGLDDIEGLPAHMTFIRTLLEGPVYLFRLYFWAWKKAKKEEKTILFIEGSWFVILTSVSIIILPQTPVLLFYILLVLTGGWAYPLFTVYIPHNANEKDPVLQTKAFRGRIISAVFAGHNYHLEHHLYPMVPHQNWHKLAKRLDSHLQESGIKPIVI